MKEVNKNRKDEILSHHTEVNIDEIWAAIEPQVDLINAEKKRKKRFLIFFLLGAILLASSGLYMWQNGTSDLEANTINNIGVENNTEVETTNSEALVQETQEGSSKKLTKTIQNTDNQLVNNSNSAIKNNVSQSNTASFNSKELAIVSKKNIEEKVKSATHSNANKISNSFPNKDNPTQQINTINEASLGETVVLEETLLTKKKPNSKPPTPIIPSPPIAKINNQLPSLIPDVGEVDIEENDADNDGNLPGGKLSFALAANTGISFINRGLASNIDGEISPEVLKLRRESETLLEAIHYGLRAKLTHKSGLSLSTGAQYTVLSERYDNNNRTMASDSIEGIVKRVIQLNGDTVDVFGLVPRTTTYNYEKEIFNRYKMIDIPFIVGFEGGMKEWSLGIQAGVFVNLALKTSGQVINTATEDINIGDKQSDIFKSKVGLSYYGGIYIRRALSPNLDITIAPHGRFFAQDFNVDRYNLKQRYSLIGVQAGLSYRFGY